MLWFFFSFIRRRRNEEKLNATMTTSSPYREVLWYAATLSLAKQDDALRQGNNNNTSRDRFVNELIKKKTALSSIPIELKTILTISEHTIRVMIRAISDREIRNSDEDLRGAYRERRSLWRRRKRKRLKMVKQYPLSLHRLLHFSFVLLQSLDNQTTVYTSG